MPEKGSDAIFVMLKFLSVWKSLSARTASRRSQFVKTVCNVKKYSMPERSIVIVFAIL